MELTSAFWKHLKSGTDIRGVALDGVPGQDVELTDEVVERIAAAFVVWLAEKTGKPGEELTVSLGRDSRLSGPRLRDAVSRALTAAGVTVLDCGLASTPAMFMTTVDLHTDAAIQLTASHHPFHRNGLKFFLPSGGLEGSDIAAILRLAEEERACPPRSGRAESCGYMRQYAARLRSLIIEGVDAPEREQPLKGFHIVVDAGNGAGGFYASDVLAPLGADVAGSQFLEPDGRFPNHIPNPEDAEAMDSVRDATVRAGADLGVIFDTDVDRAGCVGPDGREINRNRLIALAAAIALEKDPGGTIVTDSVTSSGLKEFIEKDLGGVHCRFKRGYKNVINEAIRLNQTGISAPLAIETSGHAALRENYFLDDGAYLITRIIIQAARMRRQGRQLEDLIAALKEPAESAEVRFAILQADFAAYGQGVLERLEAYARSMGWPIADDSREGVRLTIGDGWLLLRLSVHDPVMPMNFESDHVGGCQEIAAKIRPFLEEQDGLNKSQFEAYQKG